MSINPATHSPASQPLPPTSSNPPPTHSGSGRLIGLLALLAVAIGALAYDYAVAGPANEADDKKLEKFVDELNRKGVTDSKRITPEEIHKVLGRGPTWVDEHPDETYEIEYYCQWGYVPVLNMRRQYIAVVYVGDKPRRYNSHHKNERPPLEALPIIHKAPEESTDPEAVPESAAADGKSGEAAADGAPAEGTKKRKGKKKQEAQTESTSEEKQQEAKPEGQPGENTDEKKAD